MWKLRSGEGCKLPWGHSEVKLAALSLIPSLTEHAPTRACCLLKWNEPAQSAYVVMVMALDPSHACVLS